MKRFKIYFLAFLFLVMSVCNSCAGNAQRYEIILDEQPLFKMYHYTAGTSSDKTIWSDAAKTTPLAQPVIADANGQLTFFADGIYRMVFKTSADASISNMDYDDFLITADFSTGFETNQGTVLPSATTANKGNQFLLLDVSNNILGLYVSDSTQYKAMAEFNATGLQQLDSVISKTMPVFNVKHTDYGAIGDGSVDDTSAIQTAINAVPSTGGVIYFPQGRYKVDASNLTITNKSIVFIGDGTGLSVIETNVVHATGLIDFNANLIENRFIWKDLDINVAVNQTYCINCEWPSTAGFTDPSNFLMSDCYIGPTKATRSTVHIGTGIYLNHSKKPTLNNVLLRGNDAASPTTTTATGVSLQGFSQDINITGSKFRYLNGGVILANSTDNISVSDNEFIEVETGIGISSGGACENLIFSSNRMDGVYTTGIGFGSASDNATIIGNTINLSGSATGTRYAINGTATNFAITGNNLVDDSSTGTSFGISLGSGSTNGTVIGNNVVDMTNGIQLSSTSGVFVTGNHDDSSTFPISDIGAGATLNFIEKNNPSRFVVVASATALGASSTLARASNLWDVSGTTTVTSISVDVNPWIERKITLKFSGILTFTDGSNLSLAGNFVTSADDIIVLQYDGTVWNELSRSAN